MADATWSVELHCRACDASRLCNQDGAIERLRALGMLRRQRAPASDELLELLRSVAGRLRCTECECIGLAVRRAEDDFDWREAPNCAGCGRPIPAERLEALPGAKLCATCQQDDERGAVAAPEQYCPRCGAPMVPRQSRGAGITRYVLACSAVPPCRWRGRSGG